MFAAHRVNSSCKSKDILSSTHTILEHARWSRSSILTLFPALFQEKNVHPKARKQFFAPCVGGGGKYLLEKHLHRARPPEKIFKKRPPSTQTAPGSRAKSGRNTPWAKRRGQSSAVTVRAATVSGAGKTGQAIGSNGRTKRLVGIARLGGFACGRYTAPSKIMGPGPIILFNRTTRPLRKLGCPDRT